MSLKNRARDTNVDDELTASDPARRASGVQARAQRALSEPKQVAVRLELPLISIGAPADPSLLEPTYAYLAAYCFACLPPQVAQRLNVAVYELYANALRYGSNEGEVRLEIRRIPGGQGASLEVTNYAGPTELERLRLQIARVQEDPAAAFSGEMNRFAGGSSQPPPMLGIVRVAHESALPLTLSLEGSRVSISTSCEG